MMLYNREEVDYSHWRCSSCGKTFDSSDTSHLDWERGGVCPVTNEMALLCRDKKKVKK